MSKNAKQIAKEWVDRNEARLMEISDAIWSYAELGYVEFKSSKLLADELEKHGFTLERGVAGIPTAFVGTWGSGKPVIGVMGEYDALPGLSQKVAPNKDPIEAGAPGHGCGHNIHGTSGLGGAIALRYAMDEAGYQGTVKFFGCPAEEMLSGKVWMVREGVFDGVDAVLSHHPSSMNVAGLSSSNANNAVKFHFRGKTSHAAGSPEQGRSALDAVELMNIGVNFLREHIIQDARIHYVIEEGGGQPNVVPDYARSWYLVRAPERDQLDPIYNRVLKIAEGAAMMTETELEVDFIKGIYNKVPSLILSEAVTSNMREIGAPEYSEEEMEFARSVADLISAESKRTILWKTKRPEWEKLLDVLMDSSVPDAWNDGEVSHGSTDVSDVSWMTPTMEFSTATYILGTPGHSWQNVAFSGMSIGHKSLFFASKVIAATAIDLLTKPDLLKAAWKELDRRKAGRVYKSPIPADLDPPLDQWKK
ncbi:MAG: M20 family metallopeptidase [Candidatus Bathyarchaeota archaeon]|nr:M20 family metallopeptidase [Candidatus Bathyarchaeota archaeon]